MSQYNKNYLFPIYLSLALVVGMFIGNFLPKNSNNITVSKKNPSEIHEALQLINQFYLDTVNNKVLIKDAIKGMLESLDPHSTYETAEENRKFLEEMNNAFEGIGVQFHIQNDTLLVVTPTTGGPSEKVGVRAGDRIIKVDSLKITNIGLKNEDVFRMLRGKKGSKVALEIYRPKTKKTYHFNIVRDVIPTYSVIAAYMINSNTGYIRLDQFTATTADEMTNALQKLKKEGMTALVLDLRSNSGGYLDAGIKVADEFLKKGEKIVYTEGLNTSRKDFYATAYGNFETGKLAVLIDEFSASAAEIVAGAIQDNDRGTVIGRRSFGKGLVQQQFPLQSGSVIKLTVSRYHTPSGRCIQRPYDNGTQKYYNELVERILDGEKDDNLQLDSALKYQTVKGRTVYGGGGITPDIYVAWEKDTLDQPTVTDIIDSGREAFYRKLNAKDKTVLKALEVLRKP